MGFLDTFKDIGKSVIGSVAGPLAGGALDLYGASVQQSSAKAASREQMEFQNQMWKKSAEYNTKRYKSQVGLWQNRYDHAMKDMKASGLNPLLAAGATPPGPPNTAGAPGVPSGSAYQAINPTAGLGRSVSQATTSGLAAYKIEIERKRTEAQTSLIKKQGANVSADTMLKNASAREVEARTPTHAKGMELTTAKVQLTKDQQLKTVMEAAVKKKQLSIMEKELILAIMDIDIYKTSIGGMARWLKTMGISAKDAQSMAGALIRLLR